MIPQEWDHLRWLYSFTFTLHQHCTDEARKAKTVLSAVTYIYIYIYIYMYNFAGLLW